MTGGCGRVFCNEDIGSVSPAPAQFIQEPAMSRRRRAYEAFRAAKKTAIACFISCVRPAMP